MEELDEALRGASAGDDLKFSAPHPADEDASDIEFAVTVTKVQEKVLPEADDAFAADVSEFETLDELRADLVERSPQNLRQNGRQSLDMEMAKALSALAPEEIPQPLIRGEVEQRLNQVQTQAQQQGVTIEQMLMMSGENPETSQPTSRRSRSRASRNPLPDAAANTGSTPLPEASF